MSALPSRTRLLLVFLLFLGGTLHAETEVIFRDLAPLPHEAGAEVQPGVAGAFTGSSGERVILAGGANFPLGMPWEESPEGQPFPKIYQDEIFLLDPTAGENGAWEQMELRLPEPLGYGATVSHPDLGVICLGGERKEVLADSSQKRFLSAEVFALRLEDGRVTLDADFPSLPEGRTMHAAVLFGEVIYVAGGDAGQGATSDFLCLDLSRRGKAGFEWTALPSLPGKPRILPLLAVQESGQGERLHLFSGRNPGKGSVDLLTDAWEWTPDEAWAALPDVRLSGEDPRCVMAGVAVPMGVHHILVLGGAAGDLFQRLDYEIPAAIEAAKARGDELAVSQLEGEKLQLLEHHPGFSRDVLAYHTVTQTWSKVGESPDPLPVTLGYARLGKEIILPSGEVSPGVRTARTLALTLEVESGFGWVNYSVLGGYLGLVLLNGLYFSRRIRSTEDFFKAGGRIPWWAAGLSIFGTQLSAITFIAMPAAVFATDWRRYWQVLGILIVAPLVIRWFLPFYRRLNVTTAYEYLERRFNVFVRCFGSIMFMLLQFARVGIVLFLPSIALSVVTGMSVDVCILIMGVLCILYTALGGMEAVIWTDVTQVIVLAGGAVVCLVVLAGKFGGGWNEMISIADTAGKFRALDFRWLPGEPAFLVIVLGALTQNLVSYGTDQAVVQRYLTTRDEAASARGIWTNALLCIPATLIFFLIGSSLWAFYQQHPESLSPAIESGEALLPWFVVQELPVGVAGLLIAAVFAASMSSLDSAMNSVAAAFTTDFYGRFRRSASAEQRLRVARRATLVVGLSGMVFALAMAHSDIRSIWDQFAFFLGLFGGGLGGVFLLAIFTQRTHGVGAAIGLMGSGVVQFVLIRSDAINPWFFGFTGMGSCLLLGYLSSLLIPGFRKDHRGLTIYTLHQLKP